MFNKIKSNENLLMLVIELLDIISLFFFFESYILNNQFNLRKNNFNIKN